jgi:hypothetical protein
MLPVGRICQFIVAFQVGAIPTAPHKVVSLTRYEVELAWGVQRMAPRDWLENLFCSSSLGEEQVRDREETVEKAWDGSWAVRASNVSCLAPWQADKDGVLGCSG